MNQILEKRLQAYSQIHNVTTKGKLSVVLHVTRKAIEHGLPLVPSSLRTTGGGQVLGLSRSSVQAILKEHGIERVLAQEGGRTSRGSLSTMENYVAFLNELGADGIVDLKAIEAWWIRCVLDFFASQPFVLRYDISRSLQSMIRDLLAQAKQVQVENPGTQYMGAMLQHLVGAKLELVLRERGIELRHHGASVADAPTSRLGDFVIDKVAIHVTTAPTQQLMAKCKENLQAGYRPVIVTIHERVPVAEGNAEIENIKERVDILSAEQFLSTNLHELSAFQESARRTTIDELIEKYNQIIDRHETDPSLRIRIG